MLENEQRYYEKHRDELVLNYLGKFVVISGDHVVAAYDNDKEAILETMKTIPMGSFMVKPITKEERVIRLSSVAFYA
ncbi:hypothetical protein AGMMS50268_10600 [Spirochaetia bacterium]|nr:hypothetical protein AGMMS50268_10600 [Spirochaetia bacterium]